MKLRAWIASRFGAPGADAPRDSAAKLCFLGEAACDAGRTGEAIDLIERAIRLDGDVARYHYKLGVALQSAGELERARASYLQAIALDGADGKAWNNLGAVAHAQGRLDAAIESYDRALALQPDLVEAARNLGIAWSEAGDAVRAEHFSRLALGLDPRSADLRLHLARVLRHAGRLQEALDWCREATALDPGSASARFELGRALKELGRWDEAVAALRRGIALQPQSVEAAEAWVSLGAIHDLTGESGGIEESRRALEIQPDSALVRYNHGLHLLLLGDYAKGWAEYEWRWRLPEVAPELVPRRQHPHWDGGALSGESILLYAEQGYGDAIQFFRYAPLVAQRGARVFVYCSSKLAQLFRNTPGIDAVVDDFLPPPPAQLYCSLLSLPGIFGTTVDTVPAEVPYLFCNPESGERWRARLARRPARLKVGLCWATDSRSRNAALRSLELETLAPLGGIRGIEFYSLQRGEAAAQAARPPCGMELVDLAGELRDFADDAALIAALDLVISIDTATAHLAGALGKPVWTVTSFPPDWRWLLRREDTPWYPTMRLFRQQRMRDWSGVARRLADALAERVA